MNHIGYFRKGICLTGCALVTVGTLSLASAQQKSVEEETKIHRLENTKRAIYDAFTYVNRIPEAPNEDESPRQFIASVFSRLANQEGRILLKMPPGMDRESYLAFKIFFRYEGEAQTGLPDDAKVGNCGACHVPSEFTDMRKHVVTKGGSPTETPSLRNLKERGVDVAQVLEAKIEAAKLKRSGKADEIDDLYAEIDITEEDIPGLVAFLNLLNDGPDSEFRGLILKSKVLDTSDLAYTN